MAAKNTENKKRILLIDEESDISILVGLQQEGYKVMVCASPQRAWGFVYPIRPDFIVIHIPRPSSRDIYALQECRALADGVPVIIAVYASQSEALIQELGDFVPPFLYLPLRPNAVRQALDGLDFSIGDKPAGSEWSKQF